MTAFGIPSKFIDIIEMLFKDAQVVVKVNSSLFQAFHIGRGVRQRCPLAPYLFIIVAEVLNTMAKVELREGLIKEISFSGCDKEKLIVQFADDTSLTLLKEENSTRQMIALLDRFYLAIGLVLNWGKSTGY